MNPLSHPGLVSRAIETYGWAVDWLDRMTTALCALLLVAVVALSATEIVARSFFQASSVEVVDLTLQLAILMYFLGYLSLLNRNEDVAIDYFHRRIPTPIRRVVDILAACAIAAFFAVLLVKSVALFRLGLRYNHPVFPIPNAVTITPALLGSLGGLLVAVRKTLDALAGASSPPPARPEGPPA
jgi:TRAP-type C4-dicarboxylate transport system permease small subunit